MIAVVILLSLIFTGFFFSSRFFVFKDFLVQIVGAFLVGSLVGVSFVYFLTSYVTFSLFFSVGIFFFLSVAILFLYRKYFNTKKFETAFTLEVFFSFVIFLLSCYLFFKGFRYDSVTYQFLIASNTYLDFGVHIPFIRSFSLGNNYPMEVPFFSGTNVFYHFMFDFYAGLLEWAGMRIDYAFNGISAVAFSGLLIMIYKLSFILFKKRTVAALSVLFFVFNSSLSFLEFFQKYGLNFSSIWHNAFYFESGPLGSRTIGVFWTLNAYLNQRQLIFGLLFVIFLLYTLFFKSTLSRKQLMFLGLLIGLLPFWHTTMFISIYILFAGLWISIPKLRKSLFTLSVSSLIFVLPSLILITAGTSHSIIFKPGFVISDILSIKNIFLYWFWNLGFLLPTALLGFFLANSYQKRIFLSSFLLFLIPNFFQISTDMYDNHKFFNLWIILIIPFSALFVVRLFEKGFGYKIVSVILGVFMILSGILNLFVVKNDVFTRIDDYNSQPITMWIYDNIPNNSIVVSNGEIYDPLSIMGRKTYLGRSYYIYTYGKNPYDREKSLNNFLQNENIESARSFLKENNISYVVLYRGEFTKNPRVFNKFLFKENFNVIYEDDNGIIIKI